MSLFGGERQSGATQLERIIREIGEPIDAKGLVQYVTEDRRRELWALLLLTPTSLHVLYGEGQNWFARLTSPSPPDQHDLVLPFSSILEIEIPERGGVIRRLLSGPTRMAVIHSHDADPIRLEVDDPAAKVLEEARARIARD